MDKLFAAGAWEYMNNRQLLVDLCKGVAEAVDLAPSDVGALYGGYTPREKKPAHPRPLTVVDTLHAANETTDESLTQFDSAHWLRSLAEKHVDESSELWPLQLVGLAVLYMVPDARALLCKSTPEPVATSWIETIPDRLPVRLFGLHGADGAPDTCALSAAHTTVAEVMALRKAYESCDCV